MTHDDSVLSVVPMFHVNGWFHHITSPNLSPRTHILPIHIHHIPILTAPSPHTLFSSHALDFKGVYPTPRRCAERSWCTLGADSMESPFTHSSHPSKSPYLQVSLTLESTHTLPHHSQPLLNRGHHSNSALINTRRRSHRLAYAALIPRVLWKGCSIIATASDWRLSHTRVAHSHLPR